MNNKEGYLTELKAAVSKEVKIIKEIVSLHSGLLQARDPGEKALINSQVNSLKTALKKTTGEVSGILEDMSIVKPLPQSNINIPGAKGQGAPVDKLVVKEEIKPTITVKKAQRAPKAKKTKHKIVDVEITPLEKKILKRLKQKKKKIEKRKEKKPSKYVSLSNKIFGGLARDLSEKQMFLTLKMDIIKANLQYVIASYISVMLFSTLIAIFAGFFIMLFFLFFNIGAGWPIITSVTENIGARFLKVFWIILATPILTFLFMYFYPSAERTHRANRINTELPFATIHMSAISGSMVEPSKIFSIMISTKEYPYLEKEFTKLINEINIYGYDFVTALRNVASNNPSAKLAELFNGLATTITSGGNLSDFFDKRAQSLLFEYKLEREKYTKGAETFMDIYISLVIAAPMILMLLLIMMRVSGLGISMSTSMITLVMVLGVTMVNILFLTFLHLKQPQT
jgi:hypothetical protein